MSGSGAKDKGVSRETRAYLLLVLCAAIWGFAFVAQRLGAEYTGAFTFNATRSALGIVVGSGSAIAAGIPVPRRARASAAPSTRRAG